MNKETNLSISWFLDAAEASNATSIMQLADYAFYLSHLTQESPQP
jgi:hypothetical protein